MSEQVAHAESHTHEHPSDFEYVKVALVLAAITAVEVFTYFESVLDWGAFLIPSLLIMMVVKFWLVARMFMHLKNDEPVLGRFFAGGLALATVVYIIALLAFNFWS
jgi:cytochrome c oxidase subunit 4